MPNTEQITDFDAALKAAKKVYEARGTEWLPVSYDIANEMLNVVPPAYYNGYSFATGEAYSFRDGTDIYLCFRKIDPREDYAEARYCSIAQLKAEENG